MLFNQLEHKLDQEVLKAYRLIENSRDYFQLINQEIQISTIGIWFTLIIVMDPAIKDIGKTQSNLMDQIYILEEKSLLNKYFLNYHFKPLILSSQLAVLLEDQPFIIGLNILKVYYPNQLKYQEYLIQEYLLICQPTMDLQIQLNHCQYFKNQ